MEYPDYYVQPFHAYEEGNLNWLAAFEVESATYSMALRTFPEEGLSPAQAQQRLRDGIHGALRVGSSLAALCLQPDVVPATKALQDHERHPSSCTKTTKRERVVLAPAKLTC